MSNPVLFDPLQIRSIRFRNRIGVSPMCQYSSEDGFASEWHLVHLGSRAVGGAALVMTEAAAVVPEGRISPDDLGIWKDNHIEPLARCARFISEHGAVPGIQLAHAGRKASTSSPWKGHHPLSNKEGGWPVVGPSPIPFDAGYSVPAELSEMEIHGISVAFAAAARRALQAGFKVVEIHAAHGYLLHEFLSPLTNRRTDAYGGSLDNRLRFVRETVQAVRRVWPENLPLFIRISASDWAEGGWDATQSVELARQVKPLGVDLVDCSSGALVPGVAIPNTPGYQVPFAERIRRESGVLTAAVGLIRDSSHADQIIRNGQADVVLLARQMLREPYWPLKAARELGVKIEWPVQYARARE